MKLLSPFVGFLLVALWLPYTTADISLSLRNKRQYLPPPIQELPISQENHHQHQEQTKFEENNYGNSGYQIFEVHNHFESGNGGAKQPLAASNAQASTEEIRIQHINAPTDFPVDDPNLEASYLSLAAGQEDNIQPIIVKHETKNVQTTPQNIPIPFPSNFRHTFPEKSNRQETVRALNTKPQLFQSNQQTVRNSGFKSTKSAVGGHTHQTFKGQDYLSPQTRNTNIVASFKAPDYLPPQQQISSPAQKSFEQKSAFKSQKNFISNAHFKGPAYLPPQRYASAQLPSQKQTAVQSTNSAGLKNPFKGPDYLPPPLQQGSAQSEQSFADFKGPDYLPPVHQGSAQSQQSFSPNSDFKAPDYLPPPQHGSAQSEQSFSGPDYLPPQKQSYSGNTYKGPDYLPPVQGNSVQQNSNFKGPDYLPPLQQQAQENVQFKGPDYLPPQQQQTQQNAPFKGPDYLPPQQQQTQENAQFKGPDYLPPQSYQVTELQDGHDLPLGYDFQRPPNAEQAIEELHKLPEQSVEYQEANVQTQILVEDQANQPKTNGYLPPGYDTQKPENSEQSTTYGQPFRASQYLPSGYEFQKPENAEEAIKELHTLDDQTQSQQQTSQSSGGYLPPGYGFQKPSNSEQAIAELHGQQNSYNQQQTLTQVLQNQQPQTFQGSQVESQRQAKQISFQQTSQPALEAFRGPEYLPPTTSIKQISKAYKGPDYLPPVASSPSVNQQTAPQVFQAPDYLPPSTSVPSIQQPFKGPDYLPPATTSHSTPQVFQAPDYLPPATNVQPSVSHQVFQGPNYLPPVSAVQSVSNQGHQQSSQGSAFLNVPHVIQAGNSQQTQFQAPDYLPPTPATYSQAFQPTFMYPLSSFMTKLQPSVRYGSSWKPFAEYGLPTAQTPTISTKIAVSPMYREPTSRPPFYAPAMSYANSQTYSSSAHNQYQSSFNQQTRQVLRNLMPEDLRQGAPSAPVQTSKPISPKIRTVQIVNPNAVKTLKVLESLDHAGVKTIEILGPTHEQPMGEHRVIKVVNGGTEQSVKIFNDQQDVATSNSYGQTQNNGYLPPRHKRNSHNRSKAKGSERM